MFWDTLHREFVGRTGHAFADGLAKMPADSESWHLSTTARRVTRELYFRLRDPTVALCGALCRGWRVRGEARRSGRATYRGWAPILGVGGAANIRTTTQDCPFSELGFRIKHTMARAGSLPFHRIL